MKPSNTLTGFWMNTVKHFFNHKTLKLFAHQNLQICSRFILGNQCFYCVALHYVNIVVYTAKKTVVRVLPQCAQPVVITGLTVELLGMSNCLNIPSCKQGCVKSYRGSGSTTFIFIGHIH